MKKLYAGLMALFLVFSVCAVVVSAEEVVETPELTEEDVIPAEDDGGATPDQPLLWGLDRALERIDLALTLGKAAKAQKGLEHARERLLEVRAMIQEKKLAQAEKAMEEHGKALGKVKERIKEIESDDPEEELEQETAIEEEVAEHEEDISKVDEEIEAQIEELGEEEIEDVDGIITSMEENVAEADIEVKSKEMETAIKLKAKEELSDAEVEAIKERLKEKFEARKESRAAKALERFERMIAKAENRIEKMKEKGIDTTALEEKLAVANELRAQAEELKEAGDLQGLRETIKEAKQLRREARAGKPFDETGKARAITVISRVIERKEVGVPVNTNYSEVNGAVIKLTAVIEKLRAMGAQDAEDIDAVKEEIKNKLQTGQTDDNTGTEEGE